MSPTRVHRLFARYVAFAGRRTGWLLAALLVVAGLALASALRLELHTDFSELLPDQHPAVRAFRSTVGKQKSATNLVMIVHGPDEAACRRFTDALRPELDRLVAAQLFTEVVWRPDGEVPEFLSRWRWLYADQKTLERAEALLDRIIAKRSSPLMVDLEGDPEKELTELRQSVEQKLPPKSNGGGFYQATDGEHWLGIMMWRKRDGMASAGDHETLRQVQAAVARVDPRRFGPHVAVEYTGHIAQAIDEQKGIRDDLTLATGLCMSGVLLVIFLYFRRVAVLWVVGAPAVLGVLLALSLASFTIHFLNINTAFLISIILGNGINTPIIVMARFGEERRAGVEVQRALAVALSETLLGTLAAMAAASIAYGSLLATSFRGFNQFGLLGGAGMLLVWLATVALVPPMVIFGERRRAGLLTPRENWVRPAFAAIGRFASNRPVVGALIIAVVCAALARPLVGYARDSLEWDLSNLRSEATPAIKLWTRMEALGMGDVGAGDVGNDGVFLVDRADQADVVAEAVRRKDALLGDRHVLKTVRTFHSALPEAQAEKLALLTRVRAKVDKNLARVSDGEARALAEWRPPDYLRPLTLEDLPRKWQNAFTENDGTRGRFIGVDADNRTYSPNNGHDLLRIAKALRVDALGKTWVAASAATIFAGMLETIADDGPRVTALAVVAVSLLVIAMFGPAGGATVLASLAIGILWLGGMLGVWDTTVAPVLAAHKWWEVRSKLNFVNFVALPITVGVGADYAANIWARLRREPHGRMDAVLGDTGSAVALCSLTTIIGYSTLLLSRNHALRSFGLVADLGEVACLAAALVAMPVIVRLCRMMRRCD